MTNDDMNLWDDERIIQEAAASICWFAAYLKVSVSISPEEFLRRWHPCQILIGWCLANKDKIHFARKEVK